LITREETDAMVVLVSNDLKTRSITAGIGIPILLFVFNTGGSTLLTFMALVAVLGTLEFDKLLLKNPVYTAIINLAITICLYLLLATYNLDKGIRFVIPAVILNLLICRLLIDAWLNKSRFSLKKVIWTIYGWVYTGFFPAIIYRLSVDMKVDNPFIVLPLGLLIAIWIADSAAYFIGMRFGKHRGIFKVSPNKSLEGFIAGILLPFIIGFMFLLFIGFEYSSVIFLVAFSAGCFGQIGDLLESRLKRIAGVKDSSNIIPGHGGVLDRFDSLLIAGPFLYLMLRLFGLSNI
jgi:phosphatidate cytidylyltransferase